jgi:hypothetical protein
MTVVRKLERREEIHKNRQRSLKPLKKGRSRFFVVFEFIGFWKVEKPKQEYEGLEE